jgi:hypothetical protein
MVHSSRWCRALTVVLALAVAPFAGEAQPAGKVPRLGILWPYSPAVAARVYGAWTPPSGDAATITSAILAP